MVRATLDSRRAVSVAGSAAPLAASTEDDRSLTETQTTQPPLDAPGPGDVRILLVDDQPANLMALEAVLEPLGYQLVRAESGADALKRLLKDDYALIVLDVFMPEIDGFETASLIRSREKTRSIPIIFLTAMGKSDTDMFHGYEVGAVDYLFKPLVPEILRSKVQIFVELYLKTEAVRRQEALLRDLQLREQEARLAEAQRQLESERRDGDMRLARAIQQRLFPSEAPHLRNFEVWGRSYPADETGGDYFDYLPSPTGTLDVVIGDVSGHGYGPALLMTATRAYLRALALTQPDLARILELTNRALASDLVDGRFMTLLLARLDPKTRTLVYSSAGHSSGYILDRAGALRATLDATSIPLGVMHDSEFPAAPPVRLRKGDLILLHTDGLVEAHRSDGTRFGIERVLEIVRSNRHLPAEQIGQQLCETVRWFESPSPLRDDLTAVIIKVH